jgi:diphthine-ammonia ligase
MAKEDDVPTLFLAVKSLPRDALVEKQILLHTGRVLVPDEEDEDTPVWTAQDPETRDQVFQSASGAQAADCSSSTISGSTLTVVCLQLSEAGAQSWSLSRTQLEH